MRTDGTAALARRRASRRKRATWFGVATRRSSLIRSAPPGGSPIHATRPWRSRSSPRCAMPDAHYGVVAPHNAQGPVSTAMCLQIAACTPNFFIQEVFDEFNVEWEEQLVDQPARVVDGYLEIPDRPGLGIDLCLEECRRH